jgi:hypothetical protein
MSDSSGRGILRFRLLGFLLCALSAVIILALIFFTYMAISEAFGSGPPYYGRSTNMDKWSNPVPILTCVNAFGLVLAGLLGWSGFRMLAQHSRGHARV